VTLAAVIKTLYRRKLASLVLWCSIVACGPAVAVRYPKGIDLVDDPTRDVSQVMPQVEWPPPPPASIYEVPPIAGERLGDLFGHIKELLHKADLPGERVFAIGDDGFAVVTPLENITETGLPRSDTGRFNFGKEGQIPPKFTLSYYLDTLMNRNPGRFRFFAMLVSPRIVTTDPQSQLDWPRARTHHALGATHLPGSLADQPVARGTHMTVLVYEFRKLTSDSKYPVPIENSAITAQQHLRGARLLP
jgi:hypothetical protein